MKLKIGITSEEISKELLWLHEGDKVSIYQHLCDVLTTKRIYTTTIVKRGYEEYHFSYVHNRLYRAYNERGQAIDERFWKNADIILREMENLFANEKGEESKMVKSYVEKGISSTRNCKVSAEEARDAIDIVAVSSPGSRVCWDNEDVLHRYIERQEKVTKLLELYKVLSDSIIDNVDFLDEDQRDILQQIGEIKDGLK